MTDRISDDRLEEYIEWAHQSIEGFAKPVAEHYALLESALRELQERRKGDAPVRVKTQADMPICKQCGENHLVPYAGCPVCDVPRQNVSAKVMLP